MNRTLNVVRMQLVNRMTYIWIPLIILGASFVLSLLIWAMIPPGGQKYSGGSQAPLWYFFAVGIQALTLTFPFSQAMSVTRRSFFVGTMLTAGITSAILALVFVLGGLLELATGGWGMKGYFFHLDWVWADGAGGAALFIFVVAILFFLMGFWGATIFKRFGAIGLTIVLVALGLLLVGGFWLIGRLDAWPAVGSWLGTQTAISLGLWGLVLAAVLALVSFATMRRLVP
jgi:hypothetical protein